MVSTIVQSLVYSTVGIISLLSNVFIVVIITVNKRMRTKNNFLLVNLAVTDLLIVINGIPVTLYNLNSRSHIRGIPCQVFGFLILVPFLGSNFNLTLIAFHRYLLISHTNFYLKHVTKIKLFLAALLCWCMAVILSLFPIFGWGRFLYHEHRAHCMVDWKFDQGYLIFLQVLAFPVPLIFLIFCYYKVMKKTASSRRRLKISADRHNLLQKLNEQKLTLMLVTVVITFVICFLPYAVMIYIEGFSLWIIPREYSFLAMMFAYGNSMCDFWIYAAMSKKFRSAVRRTIRRPLYFHRKVKPTLDILSTVPARQDQTPKISKKRADAAQNNGRQQSINHFYVRDQDINGNFPL